MIRRTFNTLLLILFIVTLADGLPGIVKIGKLWENLISDCNLMALNEVFMVGMKNSPQTLNCPQIKFAPKSFNKDISLENWL